MKQTQDLKTTQVSVPDSVRQKFGDQIGAVEQLCQTSEEFLEICLDYQDCFEVHAGLSTRLPDSHSSVQEFVTLMAELEGEIVESLAVATA